MMEVLDLFSAAAGGWSLGMHRAGYRTMAACEFVDWRRALYQQNNPGVKIYDDVRTLTADRLVRDLGRLPSVIVGSPLQPPRAFARNAGTPSAEGCTSMSELVAEILTALNDRGYAAEHVNSDSRGEVFRIITTRGVTYERFKEAGQVAAWAVRHSPKEA